MIRSQTLYRGPLVSLLRLDHPPDRVHRDPAEEVAATHSVSFVERGGYTLHQGKRRWRMDSTTIFVTSPGLRYRCSHHEQSPGDVCFSVHLSPDLVHDVRSTLGGRWNPRKITAKLTNRLAYLRQRLVETAIGEDPDLSCPVLAGELLAAGADGEPAPARLFRPGQLAWYARRVEQARATLTEGYARHFSLGEIARDAGMSPFHFSRVFRELCGVPPHRFLLRVRLARAAERLSAGGGVTDTCHATGFNNLGHFIRTFRRVYGVPPSRYRAPSSRG